MYAAQRTELDPTQRAVPEGKVTPGVEYPQDKKYPEQLLAVPLRLRGRVVGALLVLDRLRNPKDATQPKRFTEADECVMEELGNLAVTVIECARLRLEKHRAELWARTNTQRQ